MRGAVPPALGILFSVFDSQELAYKTFFLASATIHFFAAFLYLKVGNELRRYMRRRSGLLLHEAQIKDKEMKPYSNYPLGARLCDRFLFGRSDSDGANTKAATVMTPSAPRLRGSLQ